MRKFTKLISESKEDEFKQHPLMNPVDWEEIFKPLIDHIEDYYNVPSPGDSLFSKLTLKKLASLIESINEDYKEYWHNVIYDGSQDTFLQTFEIDLDWNKFVDITRVIEDNCSEFEEGSDYRLGEINVKFSNFNYKSIEDLSEDIKDVCGKMKMFPKVNYTISLFFKSWHMEHINIIDGDVVGVNKNLDEKLSDFNISDLNRILISIYNNKTTSDDFIPKKYL